MDATIACSSSLCHFFSGQRKTSICYGCRASVALRTFIITQYSMPDFVGSFSHIPPNAVVFMLRRDQWMVWNENLCRRPLYFYKR